jgi:acetyl esterase/lipase
MKKKILEIIVTILFFDLLMVVLIFSYYTLADIKTKEPKELQEGCNLERKTFMEKNIFVITPKSETVKTNLKILYFHGGSYMAEATEEHWKFLEDISQETGATVILPDYPLAPKYHYKDVFNMVVPLYEEIAKNINCEEDLILMGDSAGGGLSLALIENLSNQSVQMPKKTILISPWLDVRLTNPKIDEVQKYDKCLQKETLKIAGLTYATEEGINSYLANPIDGDLSKINNVTIFTGTYDILNPDVHKLKEKAEEVGKNIEIKEYEKATHIWLINHNCEEEIVNKGYQDLIKLIKE